MKCALFVTLQMTATQNTPLACPVLDFAGLSKGLPVCLTALSELSAPLE